MPHLTALGVSLAAVSVDSPEALRRLREDGGLRFELLSDTRRKTVRAWGLLNARERGGIAFPAVFVLDTGGIIVFRSLDRTASRADVTSILAFLQSFRQNGTQRLENEARSFVIPTFRDVVAGLPRMCFGRR